MFFDEGCRRLAGQVVADQLCSCPLLTGASPHVLEIYVCLCEGPVHVKYNAIVQKAWLVGLWCDSYSRGSCCRPGSSCQRSLQAASLAAWQPGARSMAH